MVDSYAFILRRRLPFIITVTAAVAVLIFTLVKSRAAEFTSEAVIAVGTGGVAEGVIGQRGEYEDPVRLATTQADAFVSRPVAELAARSLRDPGAGEVDTEQLL